MTQALGLIRASEDVAVTPRSNSKCTELDLIQSSALKSYTLTNPGLTEKQLLNTKLSPSCTAEDASKDVYTQEDVSAIFNLTNSTIVHDVLTSKDTSDIQTRHFSSFVDSTKYLDTSLEELTTLKDLNDVPSDAKPVDPTSKSYATVNDRILMRDLLLITKIQNKRK